MALPIIFQDAAVVAVDKPAGLAVQPGARVRVCVVDVLQKQLGVRLFPLHRLDKDTAGVLLFAKHARAAALYQGILGSMRVIKRYRALCFGRPPRECGDIRVPIRTGTAARRCQVVRAAHTAYRVLRATDTHTYLELTLHSGRTHQIRIHLAALGCPIIGDDKYGDFARNKACARAWGVKRLQLFAHSLVLPCACKPLVLRARMPVHFLRALDAVAL
ncbi:pseudouridylate synthase [Treponema paraluiscuniculi Cuniculi A]|uniref:Pseudouridylate synthase n=2 Tax=Treponema paraluiscuniculi TaxID=53435 RepID=F7XS61_TREPU|nr:RluA family pseudouridine synthase [Treponema paraluiscuniculi]AEH40184.1 pseudouridylate synthase [Treponema paraluiscuniculi Cuniculi A]WKC72118.1 pseudouridylate synthase [Treponema paraluiscuniculi]